MMSTAIGAAYRAWLSEPARAFAVAWTSTEFTPKSPVNTPGALFVARTTTMSFGITFVSNETFAAVTLPPFFVPYSTALAMARPVS